MNEPLLKREQSQNTPCRCDPGSDRSKSWLNLHEWPVLDDPLMGATCAAQNRPNKKELRLRRYVSDWAH